MVVLRGHNAFGVFSFQSTPIQHFQRDTRLQIVKNPHPIVQKNYIQTLIAMSNTTRSLTLLSLLLTTLFILQPQASAASRGSGDHNANTFQTPDFAYPRTVIENALPVLERSLASGSHIDAIKALVQLTAAEDAVSVSSMPRMARTIDSVASATGGVPAAVLRMLEARLYLEVYESDAGTFRSRTLPLDSFPSDPLLWSEDLFALKVHSLVSRALADSGALTSTPAAGWKSLFTGLDKVSTPFYPNLYAVLAPIGSRILGRFSSGSRPIPFTSAGTWLSPSQQCAALRDAILATDTRLASASGDVAWMAATLPGALDGLDDSDAFKRLTDAYEEHAASPYSCEFLVAAAGYGNYLRENPASAALLRALIRKAVDAYPDYVRVNALKNELSSFDRPSCEISIPGEVLPSADFHVRAIRKGASGPLYLHIFKLDGKERDLIRYIRAGGGKWVGSYPVEADTCDITCRPLPPGQYTIIPSSSASEQRNALFDYNYPIVFRSTGLQAFYAASADGGKERRLYIVNGSDGSPLSGVNVVFTRDDYRNKPVITKAVTNSGGWVEVPAYAGHDYVSVNFTATRGADTMTGNLYSYMRRPASARKEAQIFPSLALYKPGAECEFAVVVYEVKRDPGRSLIASLPLTVKLFNASGEQIDSLSAVTDVSGRASAAFRLPEEGMLGDFRLVAYDADGAHLGATSVKVEEYRQPGFFVELKSGKDFYSLGEEVTLAGSVTSYSGMPMPGAEVSVTIDYMQPWWRWRSVDGSWAGHVVTDSSGHFTLTLPTTPLEGTPFATGSFSVTAAATSAAGETQRSESVRFSLGDLARIAITTPARICVEGEGLRFTASIDGAPGEPALDYSLKNADGSILKQGDFPLTGLLIPAAELPDGRYNLTVCLRGNAKVSASSDVILYRKDASLPPVDTPLWVPENNITAREGEKTVKIPVGCRPSTQSVIYVVSDRDRILSSSVLRLDNENVFVEVPAPAPGNNISVRFFTVRDAQVSEENVLVSPPERKLEMEVRSFRDHIMAGGKERWSFTYKAIGPGTSAASIPVVATLSDKALNAITPFSWRWSVYRGAESGAQFGTFGTGTRSNTYRLSKYTPLTVPGVSVPAIDTYGQPLYPACYVAERMLYAATGAATPAAASNGARKQTVKIRGARHMDSAKAEAVAEEAADMSAASDSDSGDAPGSESTQFRPAEMPLAWFRPALSTDADGNLEISFDAPDFNTTWQLQLMAWDSDLDICHSVLATVASKPVMVKALSPRFLRTGDEAVLTATLFNDTDTEAPLDAEITLFNPLTGETILQKQFAAAPIAPRGSRVVSLPFTVPGDLQFIGYRASASSGAYSDGEQSLISILPSSSPVTETRPFYLAPGETEFSMKVPALSSGAMAEMQFCDNPVWYCVTALPDLTLTRDAGILSLSNSLYGNSIALGLVRRYPAIGDAISLWSEQSDSTLVSALERSPELKIAALSATPWVMDASSETLRMQQLVRLLDKERADMEITSAIKELTERQNRDGGWSWCPGMESSLYITEQVLSRLSALSGMGYLPSSPDLDKSVKRAIAYAEKEIVKDFTEHKYDNAEHLLRWLFTRSAFPEIPMQSGMAPIKKKALADILTGWKRYDIYDAATTALLFSREGEVRQAADVLESLAQRASESREKGMWYDNLSSRNSAGPLLTTARVLRAYAEIEPASPCIDRLRQWLLIERQARDWGKNASLAEVINSVLAGSSWTAPSAPAEVRLGDRLITPSRVDALTGAFTLPIDPKEASERLLSVKRTGNGPAWGGLAVRTVEPIRKVKDFSMSDVKITKRLLIVEEDSTGTHTRSLGKTPLRPGTKVRVQLTLVADRALDYVVITDEQAACLAPVDQVSGYKSSGEVFYYREVRSGVTNLFIPSLPKGKFIVEYDCFTEGDGTYALGIATVQSLYAPMLSAHSAGMEMSVTP